MRPLASATALVALASCLAVAAGAALRRPHRFARVLERHAAMEVGTKVWMIHNGERGVVHKFGFSDENTGLACFPWPEEADSGGCVEVKFANGDLVWFGPDHSGLRYPELTQRAMGGEANADADPSVKGVGVDRNVGGDESCREYVKTVMDEKRTGEAVKLFTAGSDRRCHNEYLGGSWDPADGGRVSLKPEEAAAYRARLVEIAVAGAKLSDGAAQHVRENARLAFVNELDGTAEGRESLPAYYGLFLVRAHTAEAVKRALDKSDAVVRLRPDGLSKGETFTVYGAPGRSDRQYLRYGDRFVATVVGGGLELARPHLPDVAPEHQAAVVELLAAVRARDAAKAPLLPYNGPGGVLHGAVATYRAYREKYEVAEKLGGAYAAALQTFAHPIAALTLYVTERSGHLLGADADTAAYKRMMERPFEQLVYVSRAESVERVPVVSYACPKLAPDRGCEASGPPPLGAHEAACDWATVLHHDSNRWKRYESSAACTALRHTGKGECGAPDTDWYEVPAPVAVPPGLEYLERYGYFEFDPKHDERTWQAAAGQLVDIELPARVTTRAATAAYRLVYSLVAGYGTFLASDDGGLGLSMNVGPRSGRDAWGNWNLRCTERARWAGRAAASVECETGWETPAWDDMRSVVVLLDAVQRASGARCDGGSGADGSRYVAGAAAALSGAIEGVMKGLFGLPMEAARLKPERPVEEQRVLLFTVRDSKEGGTPAKLCAGPDGAAAAYCGDDQVRGLVDEIAKVRASPKLNEELRHVVPRLRTQLGVALRHIFRAHVGPEVEKAGYPELAALLTGLPEAPSIIPHGGDATERAADKEETDRVASENGVPRDV